MKYIVTSETEWRALRSTVVTASEAAVLVGADPYNSPKSILEKGSFTGNAYTLVGQMLEPYVVKAVNAKLGTNFELFETTKDQKEFYILGNLGATPDAHENRAVLLECKTVNAKTYMKYGAVPPSKYVIQLLTQAICTELEHKEHYLALLNTNLKTMADYESFLDAPNLTQNWDIAVFRAGQSEELCSIIKTEAVRFADCRERGAAFRVNSKVKQRVKLLIPTIIEKVGEFAEQREGK